MKIAIAQLNYHVGNFKSNKGKLISYIEQAKADQADLIVFSELAISGYPPQDLLEYRFYTQKCMEVVHEIANYSNEIGIIVGSPSFNDVLKGKKLYNTAFFLYGGRVEHQAHKTLLPNYDVFDEYRYFEPNKTFEVIAFKNHRIALTICEDLWYEQPVITDFDKSKLYTVSPLRELYKQQPDLVINIAASPFSYRHEDTKRQLFKDNAKHYSLPLIYVNQVGGNTELIFDGGSMVINSGGDIVHQLKSFEEDYYLVNNQDIDSMPTIQSPRDENYTISKIHDAVVLGVRDYFHKSGFSKATLGLSGGLDSALTLVLVCRALGKENVRALLMPSKYSSDHSVKDAIALAENLDITFNVLNIQEIVDAYEKALKPVFGETQPDVTEENIQARTRGVLLMALSNKTGHILVNTSNKSESSVGYATLYGDMNGGLSVLGDVYKSDVFKMARFINRKSEIIPWNIINKPPSAELRPNQKDTDTLPDYGLLDKILYHYIEQKRSAKEIISQGFDEEVVLWVVNKVNQSEYKRFQSPPILRVSTKAFGGGRRMPLVARYV